MSLYDDEEDPSYEGSGAENLAKFFNILGIITWVGIVASLGGLAFLFWR